MVTFAVAMIDFRGGEAFITPSVRRGLLCDRFAGAALVMSRYRHRLIRMQSRSHMTARRRLTQPESRLAALEAARSLLIEEGPQAVTLKAVAARIERTHANLLHHFGSASGLYRALAEHITATICATLAEASEAALGGMGTHREVVDLVFDAYGREGGGALFSWMLASGQADGLDSLLETVRDLVRRLAEGSRRHDLGELTLFLSLLALGDSLLGDRFACALDLPRETVRNRAEAMLIEAEKRALAEASGAGEASEG